MTAVHGSKTTVWLGGKDLSPFSNAADSEFTTDTAETTTYGAAAKTFIAGQISAKATVGGYADISNQSLSATIAAAGSVLSIFPAGAVNVGDYARLFDTIGAEVKESSPIGGAVMFNATFAADAAPGLGQLLVAQAAITAATTTTTYADGGAASTNGGILHVHIFGAPTTSVTIKLQGATSSGGTYSDISGATTAALTTVGASRVVFTGNVPQFIKAVVTLAGTTVTIGVAFART